MSGSTPFDELVDDASAATGLEGSGLDAFPVGLEGYRASAASEAQPSGFGATAIRASGMVARLSHDVERTAVSS